MAKEIDANVRQSLARGTADLWERLKEVVAHMVDRLNEPESRIHASLVTNVHDLVKLCRNSMSDRLRISIDSQPKAAPIIRW